jgi:hypothetical protein
MAGYERTAEEQEAGGGGGTPQAGGAGTGMGRRATEGPVHHFELEAVTATGGEAAL